MPYRDIQWYTGTIAREQIRLIQRHPELELVGAVVHHADKVGKDVGEIVGGEAMGLVATGDADDALRSEADVVLYNAPFERYDEIVRILASGKNVITPSAAFFPASRPELGDLEAACKEGRASLLGTGVNPGFAGDVLPLHLLLDGRAPLQLQADIEVDALPRPRPQLLAGDGRKCALHLMAEQPP